MQILSRNNFHQHGISPMTESRRNVCPDSSNQMESHYTYNDQSDMIVSGLNKLRAERKLCDAVLQTDDGTKFPIHRNVLIAASGYFHALFCGGFREAQPDACLRNPIVLRDVNSRGLSLVLECIYSGQLTLSEDTIYEVIPVAQLFLLENVISSCREYLTSHLNTKHVWRAQRIADTFALSDVKDAVDSYMLKHLVELAETPEFFDLSVVELCRYLKDDGLRGSEQEIFSVARKWLDHNDEAISLCGKVMQHVRFRCISTDRLRKVLQLPMVKLNRDVYDLITDAIHFRDAEHEQPLRGPSQIRGEEMVVIIEEADASGKNFSTNRACQMMIYKKSDIRTDQIGDSGVEVRASANKSSSRRKNDGRKRPRGDAVVEEVADEDESCKLSCETLSTEMKLLETSMGVVVVGNFLFVFGIDSDSYAGVARRFDASAGTWVNLVGAQRRPAVGMTTALAGDCIIQVGGMLVDEKSRRVRDATKFIYATIAYSLRRNEWTKASRFPRRIAFASSCTTANGVCYVVGGNEPRNVPNAEGDARRDMFFSSPKLYAYDHNTNEKLMDILQTWANKASMRVGRSEAVFQPIRDELFVIGGCKYEVDEPVSTIEVFDVEGNQWSIVEKHPGFPHDSAGAYVDGDHIVLLGGYAYQDDVALDSVSVFSREENEHGHVRPLKAKLQLPGCQLACAVLKMGLSRN